MQAVYLMISPVKDKDEKKQNWIGRATVLYFRSDTHEKKKGRGNMIVQEFQTTTQNLQNLSQPRREPSTRDWPIEVTYWVEMAKS